MPLFKPQEFVCKCGKCKEIPPQLVGNVLDLIGELSKLRYEIDRPVIINSGVRCEEHNKKVGGKPDSLHLRGKAADIKVEGVHPERLSGFIEGLICTGDMKNGGLGTYEHFVHFDIGTPRRWHG